VKFWMKVSDSFLQDLRQQIVGEGLKGMYRFWGRTLSEEGGRQHVSLYDDTFVIDIITVHLYPRYARGEGSSPTRTAASTATGSTSPSSSLSDTRLTMRFSTARRASAG